MSNARTDPALSGGLDWRCPEVTSTLCGHLVSYSSLKGTSNTSAFAPLCMDIGCFGKLSQNLKGFAKNKDQRSRFLISHNTALSSPVPYDINQIIWVVLTV